MKHAYFVGDECWIKLLGFTGTHKGVVKAYFTLDTQPAEFYIIQLDNNDYPFLEVRDATLMADAANTALPIDGTPLPLVTRAVTMPDLDG